MKLNIWTDSREEQLSSDILSKEIICFQVTETHGTQAGEEVLVTVLGLSMAHPELIPEPQPGVEARGKHLPIVKKCLLHKKQQFKPIPGLFVYSWDGIWFLNFFKY